MRKWPLPVRSRFICWNITPVTVRRASRAKYTKGPPTDKTIHALYKQFTEAGCLCKQKSSGRPLTAEDDVEGFGPIFCIARRNQWELQLKSNGCGKQQCGGFCISVWCLNHTASKWYNNCRMMITGAGLISVYSYKT